MNEEKNTFLGVACALRRCQFVELSAREREREVQQRVVLLGKERSKSDGLRKGCRWTSMNQWRLHRPPPGAASAVTRGYAPHHSWWWSAQRVNEAANLCARGQVGGVYPPPQLSPLLIAFSDGRPPLFVPFCRIYRRGGRGFCQSAIICSRIIVLGIPV